MKTCIYMRAIQTGNSQSLKILLRNNLGFNKFSTENIKTLINQIKGDVDESVRISRDLQTC